MQHPVTSAQSLHGLSDRMIQAVGEKTLRKPLARSELPDVLLTHRTAFGPQLRLNDFSKSSAGNSIMAISSSDAPTARTCNTGR